MPLFKREKKPKAIQDQKDFINNFLLYKFLGVVLDGSLFAKIRVSACTILLYCAFVHHLIPLVLHSSDHSFDEVLDLVHLEMIYLLWCFAWPTAVTRSLVFLSLLHKIKSGIFTYSDELTEVERQILSKANDDVERMTKRSIYFYCAVGLGIFLKGVNKEKIATLSTPNIGWFPFAINSLPRYAVGCLIQALMGVNAMSFAIATFLSFAMFMIHQEAQYKLLRSRLRGTFPKNVPKSVTHTEQHRKVVLRRLRDCYHHHLAILSFHKDMLHYYEILLLAFRVSCVFWLCTLAYITVILKLDAHNLMKMLSFASGELFFVFLFSLRGQDIINWNFEWRDELCWVEWWEQPKEVRNNIYTMILGASNPVVLYGMWAIAFYSHEGLFAIGNESYSFFNMLTAMN